MLCLAGRPSDLLLWNFNNLHLFWCCCEVFTHSYFSMIIMGVYFVSLSYIGKIFFVGNPRGLDFKNIICCSFWFIVGC